MFQTLKSKFKVGFFGVVAIIIVLFLIFFNSFFVIIDAGEVGVVSTFGDVADAPLHSGFHFKNPFSQIVRMNTRTASYTMSENYAEGEVLGDDSIQALAKDGGLVWFDVTVLYRLVPEEAPKVYKGLGIKYQENIIRPGIRSTIREVASEFPVNELYSTKRDEVQLNIIGKLREDIEPRGIIIEDVLLRKVNVSQTLSDSIEQKLAAEQEVEKQEFEIQKSKKVAERKLIEARAQRDAQRIVNQSLTSRYLYYLYVSNLENREGTIYVPIDPNNGLPIFRNIE